MKRTKILATYGPSIATPAKISKLISAGTDAFRVNCSHGATSDFLEAARIIRKGSEKSVFPAGLLFDISGPKLRLEHFEGSIEVNAGDTLAITSGRSDLSSRTIGVNHPSIVGSVKKGERLFIDDGNLIFEILSTGKQVRIKAINGGTLLPGKGINLPDTDIQIPTLTKKDKLDLQTAVEADADFVALSFVRSGDDIIEARRLLKKHGGKPKIIAKLEKREAIDSLEEIMMLSDGVMVARGDLGVELPPEELPKLQKRIISLANCHHKPVIVATQMLESMRFSPRATRAEISDVANAVFEFADAVMLSAETSTGKYPVEAVQTMSKVIRSSEMDATHRQVDFVQHIMKSPIPLAIAGAVTESNKFCETRVIIAFTTSGYTAGLISNLFPPQPVIALTPDPRVVRQLSLYRSVYAVQIDHPSSFEEMLSVVRKICRKHELAGEGDNVVVTGGLPFGSTVPTNFMMIQEIS